MLAKKYRLPIQVAIGKRGREMRFPNFLVKIFSSDFPYARFGVVLKKGSVKKATDRNRIRRTIFNAIKMRQKELRFPNSDFLMIAGLQISKLPIEEIRKEIHDDFDVIIKQR